MSARRKFSFLLGLAVVTGGNAAVTSYTDITQWVGTGANWSALVIDFNSGVSTDSFAWGYRWDEPANPVVLSGADMIVAIAASDPNLDIEYGGTPESGFFLTKVTYRSFSAESGDFVNNFDSWNYWVAGGTAGDPPGNEISGGGTSLPASWTESPSGAGDTSFGTTGRILANGSWDAYAFGEYPASPSGTVAAAPEPETMASLFGLVAIFFTVSRSRRRKSD